MRHFPVLVLLAGFWQAAGQPAYAQTTRVRLKGQSTNVDFSEADSTKPFKSGTLLPVTCKQNEVFLKTDESPGDNIYVCLTADHWIGIKSSNVPIPSLTGQSGGVLSTNGSSLVWQFLNGDLTGALSSLIVKGLQGRALSGTPPTDGQVLMWDNGLSQWHPATPATYESILTFTGPLSRSANSITCPTCLTNTMSSSSSDMAGTYPNLSLSSTGITAQRYGDGSHIPQITFDSKGRATTAATVPVTPAWSSLANPSTNLALNMGSANTTFTFGAATGTADGMTFTDTSGNTGTAALAHFTTASGSAMSPWQADANGIGWMVDAAGRLRTVGQTAAGSLIALRGVGTALLGLQGASAEWDIAPPANLTSWTFTPPAAPCAAHQWWTTDASGAGGCTQPASSDLSDSANVGRLNVANVFTAPQVAGAGMSTGSDCLSVQRYVDGAAGSITTGQVLTTTSNVGANGFLAVTLAATGGGAGFGIAKLTGSQTGAPGSLIDICQSGGASVLFRTAPVAGNIAITPNTVPGEAEDSGKTSASTILSTTGRLGKIGAPVTSCAALPCLVHVNLDGTGLVGFTSSGGSTAKTLDILDGSSTTLADGQSISWSCTSTGSADTCSTTWTVPAAVTWVSVTAWSGGGAGSGSSVNSAGGPGGGGGGFFKGMCPVTPGANVTITVGKGGVSTANAGTKAGDGGSSSFGSCFTLLGGLGASQPLQAVWGGRLSGTSRAGWQLATSLLVDKTAVYPNTGTHGASAIREDGGGNGAGAQSANGTGLNGGDATYGGGGGGSGAYNNATYGLGGASGYGGAGGQGGACIGTACATACTAGTVPGGGGGSPGTQTAGGVSLTGCNGARGEVRIGW
jgi:hypothetical protein